MMEDFLVKVSKIVGASVTGGSQNIMIHLDDWNTVAEAKQVKTSVRQMQKELRMVKKEIQGSFTAKRVDVQAGCLPQIFGFASRDRAVQRENLRRQEGRLLSVVDQLLIGLDEIKVELDSYIVEHK